MAFRSSSLAPLYIMLKQISYKTRWCFLLSVAVILLFLDHLIALFSLARYNEQYSYILFAPFLFAGFLYWHRACIFSKPVYSPRLGIPLFMAGVVIYLISSQLSLPTDRIDRLAITISAFVVVSTAVFVLFYGGRSLIAARFPFALYLLLIPLPTAVANGAVKALQIASADWTYVLFHLTSMPVLRDGMTFTLPGAIIEVAEECSGIRASTALLITSFMLSHLFLRATWAKVVLILLAIPLAVLKNAIRITTISWLGVYVSPEYFYGAIHHNGGPLFSFVALCILIPLLLGLQRCEAAMQRGPLQPGSPGAEDAGL